MRQFVQDAIAGLNPGERDVIELSLVQGLDGDELADRSGCPETTRTRWCPGPAPSWSDLGALLVARTGREGCTALDALLAGWDGR